MSTIFIVVKNPQDWPLQIPGIDVISSKSYLTEPAYSYLRNVKVFNFCNSYKYQSNGYYVSLLAAARGHKPIPSISTLYDMRTSAVVKIIAEDIEEVIQKSLDDIQSQEFYLSIYFGKNPVKKYDQLSMKLFNMFETPFIRAHFIHEKKWVLKSVSPIPTGEIPKSHINFVLERAMDYFKKKASHKTKRKSYRYDLAILVDPEEPNPPSDEKAIDKFIKAAEKKSISTELITKNDFSRLSEFDALFIRATTKVNHFTYRFARRAEADGLVVIDDSQSIIKCSNKVYLAELMKRLEIQTPNTEVVHRDSVKNIINRIKFPCIIKLPDSSFSKGVHKATDKASFTNFAKELFKESELIVVQEYISTDFDWRIGILNKKILYACKYFMAKSHWQIIKSDDKGTTIDDGTVETLQIEDVPKKILNMALKASNAIGNGLYGIDIKEINGAPYLIEINDNPSIDKGYEDQILKDMLYEEIMDIFIKRIEAKKSTSASE